MITRKQFLRQLSAASIGTGCFGCQAVWRSERRSAHTVISIMHTNDTHARIDPFPAGSGEYAGLGGVARRAALVHQVRRENPHHLLFDAGDVFQGTPYFNFYGGALDFELMSHMGYDAGTIGNHEFDNRVEGFVEVAPKARFPFVISNLDFSGAPAMGAFTRPWWIREIAGIRVGVFGLCVAFENLVLPELHEGVRYLNPVRVSAETVRLLRDEHACDLVVALSHLGHAYESDQVSDRVVATEVAGIDLIIGGHTHTLLPKPEVVEVAGRRPTLISQVGHAGVVLGRLDISLDRRQQIVGVTARHAHVAA